MGLRDFKTEIKERWIGSSEAIRKVFNYYKTNDNLKNKLNLNDYLDLIISLPIDVSDYWSEEYNSINMKKNYSVVYETDDWELVTPFTLDASYYISNKYLRHPGDEELFGDGVSWCTAKKDDSQYWDKYTKGKNYPIVYVILSKSKSRERYAIVFNNLYQTDDQKDRDVEFSKENFEKGHTIAEMNGEIRDFKQLVSRKQNISDIEKKFGVSLTTPINKKSKRINLSKIIYDNFDSTFNAGEKATEMSQTDKDMKGIHDAWLNNKDFKDKIKTLQSALREIKSQYGLKYKKDYHPKTFDLLLRNMSAHRYVSYGTYDIGPFMDIIKSDEDYDSFYCLFLFAWLLINDDPDSFNFIRNEIVGTVVRSGEHFVNKFLNNFRKNISSKKYPRLLNAAKKSIKSNKHFRNVYFSLMSDVKNPVYGLPKDVLEFYTLLEPALNDYGGFHEITIEAIINCVNKFKTLKIAFDLDGGVSDKEITKFVSQNYNLGKNGIIVKMEERMNASDFILDERHIEDFFRCDFFEINYVSSDLDGVYKKLTQLKKFLQRKTHPFVLNEWKGIQNFIEYRHALHNDLTQLLKQFEPVSIILEKVALDVESLMEKNGYEHKTLVNGEGSLYFFYPIRKKTS